MLIAYLNDYKMLMFLTFGVIPLIFIIGSTKKKATPAGGGHDDEPIVME
jgi:hypothetical protein